MTKQEDQQTAIDPDFAQEMESLLDQHDYERPKVGDIRDAIIVSMTQKGVIVDLGLKRDGIIQPADLDKLEPEERETLQVDDEISVYIVSTDEQDSLQVSLHMARMNEDWIRAQELLESREIVETEIIGHNRGGALVNFGRLRGFVPASHLTFLNPGMSDDDRQQRMARARGERIPVKIIEVDRRRRRLVVSHREAERVWQDKRRRELLQQLSEGDVVRGTVSGWRDFGAFVDLGGADGLIHVSELAWHRVEHPRDVVKMGQTLDVYVLKIDRERERISLSRKKLLPNPWTTVEDNYAVGDLAEGRIIRIVDYGAFVEIEAGIEGLLHTSQIAHSNVEDPRDILQEGEIHLLRIISIEADRQRMGLSLRAVTANEQIEWMTQREQVAADEGELESSEDERHMRGETILAHEATLIQESQAASDGQEAEAEASVGTTVDTLAQPDVDEAPAVSLKGEDLVSSVEVAAADRQKDQAATRGHRP